MRSIEDLEVLREQRIFVTGGTGFIGRPFVDALLNLNKHFDLKMRLTVLTRSPEAHLERWPHWAGDPALNLLQGDMRGFLYDGGADFVIHGATPAGLHQADDLGLESTILDGTARMLETFKSVKRFVFLSSGAVYGNRGLASPPVSEAEPPGGTLSMYGSAKLKAEASVLEAFSPAKVARIARLFAFVGPGLPLNGPFAMGQFFRQALNGEAITVKGSGRSRRTFMDLEDLIEVLLALMVREDFPYATCNVGSAEQVTILELAQKIDALTINKGVKVLGQSFEDASYVPDLTRLRTLNLGAQIPLDESLRRVWASPSQQTW